jgi:hypothetical protein
MPRSKVSAFFSVLLVFASGAAMGAVGYRLYAVKSVASGTTLPQSKKKMNPDEIRKMIVNQLKEKVRLDPGQLEDVEKIYDDQHREYLQVQSKYDAQIGPIFHSFERETNQLHEAAVAKIKALLRPDQQTVYEKWLADRAAADAEHKKERKEHKDRPEGKRPPLPPLP